MIVAAAFLLSMQGARDIARAPQARGTASSLFSPDDYPAKALGTGAHGKVVARLTIDTSGRVSGCAIVRSSGNAVLDESTCEILRRRARYGPGIDSHGRPVTGTVDEEIVWRAP